MREDRIGVEMTEIWIDVIIPRRVFLLLFFWFNQTIQSKKLATRERDINEFACRQTEIRRRSTISSRHADISQKENNTRSVFSQYEKIVSSSSIHSEYIFRHLPILIILQRMTEVDQLYSGFIARECHYGRNKCAHNIIKSSTITRIRNSINMDLSRCNSLVFRCK